VSTYPAAITLFLSVRSLYDGPATSRRIGGFRCVVGVLVATTLPTGALGNA
jgi:hypothetical protein